MSIKELRDLSSDLRAKTNVIAVISSITVPSRSNGNDYVVRMELVDKSFDTIVSCILFGDEDFLPNSSNIPHPAIIRLKRCKVECFQGRPQVLKGPGFSWAIFSTEVGNCQLVDKSHPEAGSSLEESERDIILDLQHWVSSPQFRNTTFSKNPTNILSEAHQTDRQIIDQNANIPPAPKKRKFNRFLNGLTPLSGTYNELYFNLVAMVVGGCHMEDEKCSVLRCLDGSKPPVSTVRVNPQYIQGNSTKAEMDALTEYYVDIQIYESHKDTAALFEAGDIVEFTNLHMYTPVGLRTPEIILHNGDTFNRGLEKLKEDDPKAISLLERISGIEVVEEEPELAPLPYDETESCLQTSATECLYPESEVVALAFVTNDIRLTLQGMDKYKAYKTRVVVDKIESGLGTECYQDCVRPYCALCGEYGMEGVYQCPNDNNIMEDKFFFVLNVRDSTSDARIICSGQGAQDLLDTEQVRPSFLGRGARIVNKWCDVHVKGCVIESQVTLFVTNTLIKAAPAFI